MVSVLNIDFHEQSKHRYVSQNDVAAFSADGSTLKAVALLPSVLFFLAEDLTVGCHPVHVGEPLGDP